MKAIVNIAPQKLAWQEIPIPAPGAGEVRIQTIACGICATDLQMIAGWERTSFPAVPGHEWAGRVDAVGPGGDAAIIGRNCVAENVLKDGGEVGFEHPGGYAEYVLTEAAKLHFLPDDFPMSVAALIEPLAVAVRGLRRLHIENQTAALVIGDGPIGLLMTLLLQRAGVADIAVVGGRGNRLDLAKTCGAGRTVNYHDFKEDFAGAMRKALGRSFPNVIEASGAATAVHAAITMTSACGKILIIGDYRDARAGFLWNDLLLKEIEVIGSNASAQAWPEAVRTAMEMQSALARLISNEFPAQHYVQAFDLIRNSREVNKIILRWDR